MNTIKAIKASPLLLALLVVQLSSRPVPVLDLDGLSENADLIAVGQVRAIREIQKATIEVDGAKIPARLMAGEMKLDLVLKGVPGSSEITFKFWLTETPVGYRSPEPLSYRVFFLKRAGTDYEFESPYYPSVVALPGLPDQGATVMGRIVAQLGGVVRSSLASIEQKQEAIYVLTRTKSREAAPALRYGLRDRDLTVRLAAAAAMLERNDIAAVQVAEAALLKPSQVVPAYLRHNLLYAISEGLKDERAIPFLTKLLRNDDAEVRRSAASALWHTHSRLAVDPLLSALEDSDLEVRYYAVVGLAEVTGQSEWRPNMDVFVSDQQRYLNHWKAWGKGR